MWATVVLPTMRRRDLLRTMTGTGVLAGVASAAASGRPDATAGDDVAYDGTRIYEYEPDGNEFAYVERFESEALRDEIGQATVTIDSGRIERKQMPKAYRGRNEPFSVEYADTAYLASPERFAEQEAEAKQQAMASARATVDSLASTPLYSYASTSTELSERTGPISVVWDTTRDAAAIEYEMQHLDFWDGECWCSPLPSKERYVIRQDGSTPSQHAGFAKNTGYFGEQWHARLWDLRDGRVVAQPHFDVADHCLLTACDFRFDRTREKVTDAYVSNLGNYDVDRRWAGNGYGYTDDDSADGYANVITPA